MGTINRADFYYGAMLSTLVKNGNTPTIVENGDSSRIYMLSNGQKKCEVYTKYLSKPSRKGNSNSSRWSFNFSQDEVKRLMSYENFSVPFSLVLICAKSECFQESEIAVLDIYQAKKCLDPMHDRSNYQITVKAKKHQRKLRVYGTGLADEQNGKETALLISRNKFLFLEGTE